MTSANLLLPARASTGLPLPQKNRPSRGKAQGSVWRKFVRETLQAHGTTCWICGHGGASTADHVVPYTEDDNRALDLSNLRPAHGNPRPCATCSSAAGKPVYCNEIKGMGSVERARRKIREMTGLATGADEEPGEREW